MNRRILVSAIVLSILIMFTVANAQTEKPKAPPKAPEGCVIVEEDYLIFFDEEPQYHFEKAKEHFLQDEKEAASKEIQKATAFLKLQESRATDEGKKALVISIAELKNLAEDIEKGVTISDKDLDHAFARAHHALTKHYLSKTMEQYGKEDAKKAGYDLKAAANHLEYAAKWTSDKVEEGFKTGIRDARTLSGKMIEGTGWVAEKVGKAMQYIADESEKLSKKVEPKKK